MKKSTTITVKITLSIAIALLLSVISYGHAAVYGGFDKGYTSLDTRHPSVIVVSGSQSDGVSHKSTLPEFPEKEEDTDEEPEEDTSEEVGVSFGWFITSYLKIPLTGTFQTHYFIYKHHQASVPFYVLFHSWKTFLS